MVDHARLYLFGDQTFDVQPHLKDVLRNRHDPVIGSFLSKAYNAIRLGIFELPPEVRDDLPRYTCVDDLLSWKQDGGQCLPLDMAVTCMYQLASFMSHASTTYPTKDSRIVGLCTGSLAAAAISCSYSVIDLIPKAVDAVMVAFHTGEHAAETAWRVEPLDTANNSWSIAVPGTATAEAVQKFCKQTLLPHTRQPYISAYAPNGLTISAPPQTLAQLTSSADIKDFKSITIIAPYHAPHLHTQHDVDRIVGSLAPRSTTSDPVYIPVFSTAGSVPEEGTFETSIKAAVTHILLQPIRWRDILGNVQAWLELATPTSFDIVQIASKSEQLIHASLRQTNLRSLFAAPKPSEQAHVKQVSSDDPGRPKLAIIAMSGRFPGAQDNEAFWNLLHQGLDVHKPVPELHWSAKTHVDATGVRKNTSATSFGCWLDNPAVFDARFFNISPREAPQIDPAQRLALMTAYEAIEQAGIVPDATPSTRRDRVGVFYGVTSNDWMETNSAQNIDTYFIPGGNRAFIPGRINYYFKFSGPSYAVDTACSSSLAGIHMACNSLWQGDIDTAIAGGTNVLTNPDFTAGLDRGHFLSRTGNCKTFDDSADGYCRGEGIGTIIIKRLDDALADHDPILGVILGAYTNHSAESESITRPHVGAQRAIFSKILSSAGVDPYSVSYVEMHGTGTQAGDAGEMSSVLDTFAPALDRVEKVRNENEALYLGSAKANIGHGEAASGVSSMIKVLLMMQKNMIVPHCGIKTKINHKFPTDLKARNVNIALEPTPWERSSIPSQYRRVFVNNFSAAGGNSAVLLEDAPPKLESPDCLVDPRNSHLVALSAKNGVSLQGNLKSLLGYLEEHPTVSLAKLSYTTTARRIHHQHRVMLTVSGIDDTCNQLAAALSDQIGMTRPKGAPKVVFAFTGQGAQYPGMGKQFCELFSVFRIELARLDQIAQGFGFPSFIPVIRSDKSDVGVFEPVVVQLASVGFQIALRRLLASWNIKPTAVVGHSLGEYVALNAAGVLSDADTIYLVGKRAELLQSKCKRETHAMLVVKGSVKEIDRILVDKRHEFACINSPAETVLAGTNEEVSSFQESLANAGLRSTLLKVPYAFHSSQMEPILAEFMKLASGVTYSQARISILRPLDGSIVNGGGSFDPEYLARHTREPVNMLKALLTAQNHSFLTNQTVLLEVGPHPAILGMVRSTLGPQATLLASSQRGRTALQVMGTSLKTLYMLGADIHWGKYHSDFKGSHEVIPLPAYSWDLKEYWMQYVNDWSLRKGDPPMVIEETTKLESTTIHRVVEESIDSNHGHMIVEANIARKDLSPLVQGHEVDGIPLCTPSVYADIALSLGSYLLKRYGGPNRQENLVDVSDMTVSKALILRAHATEQLLQAHLEVNWPSNTANIKYMTFNDHQKLQEHSRCTLYFKDQSLQQQLQRGSAKIKQKMKALRDDIVAGVTARFNRPMVYRAIRPLARFHDDYRAIDEIVLNSNTLEASSHLSYGAVAREGTYHTHPAMIDSLTQSCGFAMNCNDSTDLDQEVYMNHGWGSFQLFKPLDFEKQYTTYTRMSEGEDKLWRGDVVVFDGEEVVAFFGSIAIQGVPRRVLGVILSLESGIKSRQRPSQNRPTPVAASVPKSRASKSNPDSAGSAEAKLATALKIIAEESGLSVSDLTDSTVFADAGIDSLLGLSICARLKEDLGIDIDFNAIFFDYPSVSDLKRLFGSSETSLLATDDVTAPSTFTSTTPRSSVSGASTPASEQSISLPKLNVVHAIKIIAEESGIAADELSDNTDFADVGIDSLLSLVIVGRFRNELNVDLQHESLVLECPTIGDLKRYLLGNTAPASASYAPAPSGPDPSVVTFKPPSESVRKVSTPAQTNDQTAHVASRQSNVDEYIRQYTANFVVPVPAPPSGALKGMEQVVIVTGASGSLGGHLTEQIAQDPKVKMVVCLNREKNVEPYLRQQKAMREKGIRSFDQIRPKLWVLQTDTAKPKLGLSNSDYEQLVSSATHLVHNAWPMSAKRALSGFESQFRVMRNLIDFASDVVARRSTDFRFSFQMVSSIGVVGHYGLGNGAARTMVPEEHTRTLDAVLPNGYGEAKWACERMLDETLGKFPARFRAMAVRLGQIAGSKRCGYWSPMEHFGFLIKSSQTLGVLPDVPGSLYWTPVEDIAGTLIDLVLSSRDPHAIYHIDNPVGQPWSEMNAILADALGIRKLVPFEEWVALVRDSPPRNNPASTLLEFLDDNYLRMSCGGLVLDVSKTLSHSKTLAQVGPVSEEVARKYIHIWKEIGFLS